MRNRKSNNGSRSHHNHSSFLSSAAWVDWEEAKGYIYFSHQIVLPYRCHRYDMRCHKYQSETKKLSFSPEPIINISKLNLKFMNP